MEIIMEQLKQWIVLSISDLLKIKSYIAKKYIKMSSKERAEILSNTVNQVIDSHLEGVDQEYKNALKYAILSSTIGHSKYDITKFDVFKSIFELEIPPSTQISMASNWIEKSTELNLDASDILEFVVAYAEENDTQYIPETLIETYQDFRSRPNSSTQNNNNILHLLFRYFHNMEFVITFFIVSIIVITLSSAIVLSNPITQEIPRKISIERDILMKHNPFVTRSLFLMKTVSVTHTEEHSEVIISYEQPESDKPTYGYKAFNFMTLKSYILNIRQGYIGESPYLNEIVNIAKLNDIDPLLLISIIGQEQNFIPTSNTDKEKIINNPYNVFYSWKSYNTTLSDSTQIAINTIKNSLLKKDREDMDDIEWLNKTYAEDQNWHKGVKEIYTFLDDLCRQ